MVVVEFLQGDGCNLRLPSFKVVLARLVVTVVLGRVVKDKVVLGRVVKVGDVIFAGLRVS